MKTRTSLLLLGAASLFACSTLVGADFDDKTEDSGTSGGTAGSTGGTHAQGGQNTGGTPSSGGTTQTTGGSGTGGTTVAGSGGTTGGTSPTPTGGNSGSAGTTGGSVVGQGGIGPAAGNGGQGADAGQGGAGGISVTGGVGGEGGDTPQGGMGGEPGGAGGEAGSGGAPGEPIVVVNEVKGQGSGDDYVEIYNRGPGALALEGYGLSDANNTFIFPSGATIAEGGHVLLLLGQTAPVNGNYTCFTPNPCYHATWGISQNGESVYFRGRQNQVLDMTSYPSQTGAGALTNDQTWGRLPDGTGTFRATRPTPEAINQSP